MLDSALSAQAILARNQARITLAGHFDLQSLPSPDDRFAESWRVRIGHAKAEWIVIRVSRRFPLELPTVFVEDLTLYGRIPHVNANGELCYCDKSVSTYLPEDIKRIALWIVSKVIEVLDRGDGGSARVGYTVTKKVGNAVVRNRIRRRLKEAVRTHAADDMAQGSDYVIVARRDVLRLVAQGYSAPEIGEQLFISPKTVDTYKQRVNEKLGISHRSEYVDFALKIGVLGQAHTPPRAP